VFEFTDQAFAGVQPLLPADSRRGKPWRDHRQVLGGILWKLHTGRPWRDVPGRFGPWQTCHGRLRRWQRDGTWPRLWAVLAAGEHGSGQDRCGQAGQPVLAAAPVTAARGPDGDAATTTTTAPAALSVASTTPGRPAAAAPPRSRPGPGPNLASLEVVAVLRAQLPPSPAWARTAARNAWATSTRVTCRYQASQRRTW
jgi:transposase